MPFQVPPFSRPVDPSKVIHLQSNQDSDHFKAGDHIEFWDHLFEWDDDCLSASQLDRYSRMADPPVDDFLSSLSSSNLANQDLLLFLATKADEEQREGNPGLAIKLWNEVSRPPPDELVVTEDELERGQNFFWHNSGGIFASLLHFSLASGFSAPRITAQLHRASYLIPPTTHDGLDYLPITQEASAKIRERLSETAQFVLDVMSCPIAIPSDASDDLKKHNVQRTWRGLPSLLPPKLCASSSRVDSLPLAGEGWKSSVRVRLLHGTVRQRLWAKRSRLSAQNKEQDETGPVSSTEQYDDVPLNAEDMAGTLAGFAVVPVWCLRKMRMTNRDGQDPAERDYIRLWRHIGFYLGIAPDLLKSHFTEVVPSCKFLASVVCHIFPSPNAPSALYSHDTTTTTTATNSGLKCVTDTVISDTNTTLSGCPFNERMLPPPTMPILIAMSDSPPIRTTLGYHSNLTRFLVGPKLCDRLGVNAVGGWLGQIKLHMTLFALAYPSYFQSVYPSTRWSAKRIRVSQEGLGRLVKMSLGARKSVYRPRTDGSKDLDEKAFKEEWIGKDEAGAKQLGKDYISLLVEMIAVSVFFVGSTVVSAGWFGWKTYGLIRNA
ncbi:Domain of unknown function DUF2236 [Phaffia rhodozyma]|uniref:ER-bound oxygenase mpaB/mpaB'/Rubber oxygenase catalytic domain-containing protein n=1 Tax=Phaffia rhodozyma TaxID=264483 RepID=A0A0F7SIU6_PHARH|nr:Domain of unknown function DUF2236 [Phaffia rhodozyma]